MTYGQGASERDEIEQASKRRASERVESERVSERRNRQQAQVCRCVLRWQDNNSQGKGGGEPSARRRTCCRPAEDQHVGTFPPFPRGVVYGSYGGFIPDISTTIFGGMKKVDKNIFFDLRN